MANQTSRENRRACSKCGATGRRHMLQISAWTASRGWRIWYRLCWQCGCNVLRLYDAVAWAESR